MNTPLALALPAGMNLLVGGFVISTIAVVLAAGVAALLRRASAATRHFVWLLAFVAMAVGTPLAASQYRIALPILPTAGTASASPRAAIADPAGASPRAVSRTAGDLAAGPPLPSPSTGESLPKDNPLRIDWLLALWGAGCVAALSPVALGLMAWRGLRRASRPASERLSALHRQLATESASHQTAPLLISDAVRSPVIGGLCKPALVFPTASESWSESTLRAALRHELAHAERGDLRASAFARVVCSFLWFNPLCWLALRPMRAAAEMAADDLVVTRERSRENYALELLALARQLSTQAPPAFGLGVLHGSKINARLERIMTSEVNRRTPAAWLRGIALLAVAAGSVFASLAEPVPGPEKARPAAETATAAGETPVNALSDLHVTGWRAENSPLPEVIQKLDAQIRAADPTGAGIRFEVHIPPGEEPARITSDVYADVKANAFMILEVLKKAVSIRCELTEDSARIWQLPKAQVDFERKAAAAHLDIDWKQIDASVALKDVQAKAAAQGFAFDLKLGVLKSAPISLAARKVGVDQAIRSILYLADLKASPLDGFTGYRIEAATPEEAVGRLWISVLFSPAVLPSGELTAPALASWRSSTEKAPTLHGMSMRTRLAIGQAGLSAGLAVEGQTAAYLTFNCDSALEDKTNILLDASLTLKGDGDTVLASADGRWSRPSGTRLILVSSQGLALDLPGKDAVPRQGILACVQATLVDDEGRPWLPYPENAADVPLAIRPAPDAASLDRVQIKCLGLDGRPVEGARVYLLQAHGPEAGSTQTVSGPLLSDAQGLVAFPDPVTFPDGGYERDVYAVLPGKLAGANALRPGSSPHGEPAILPMLPTKPLRGRVELAGGKDPRTSTVTLTWLSDLPRSMARVSPFSKLPPAWTELFRRTPAADGSFEFADAPVDAFAYLSARSPGFGEAQAMLPPGVRDDVALLLQPAASIEGTVTRRETGERLSAARVRIRKRDAIMWTTTMAGIDERGHFEFSGLAEGVYDVWIPWSGGQVMVPITLTLQAGEAAKIHLAMEQGTPVEGSVTFEGRPVAHATLIVMDPENAPLGRAETNAQGRYAITLPPGLSFLYLTEIPNISDYQTGAVQWDLKIADGKVVEGSPDFQLRKRPALKSPATSATATGRVVDPQGRPFPGLLISYLRHPLAGAEDYSDEWTGYSGPPVVSGADGAYKLILPPFCEYQITVEGRTTSTVKSAKFQTSAGSSHQIEDLVVRSAGAVAAGSVVNEEGKPLSNAVLKFSSENKAPEEYSNLKTDSRGRFRIDHLLPDEPFSITATKAGYRETKKTFLPGDTDIRLVLAVEK